MFSLAMRNKKNNKYFVFTASSFSFSDKSRKAKQDFQQDFSPQQMEYKKKTRCRDRACRRIKNISARVGRRHETHSFPGRRRRKQRNALVWSRRVGSPLPVTVGPQCFGDPPLPSRDTAVDRRFQEDRARSPECHYLPKFYATSGTLGSATGSEISLLSINPRPARTASTRDFRGPRLF